MSEYDNSFGYVVILDSCNFNVSLGCEAELDCHAAVQFINSGQQELNNYVNEVIIPKLEKITLQNLNQN